jgi:hypothetical protein
VTKNYYIIIELIKIFNAKQGDLKKNSGYSALLDLGTSAINHFLTLILEEKVR